MAKLWWTCYSECFPSTFRMLFGVGAVGYGKLSSHGNAAVSMHITLLRYSCMAIWHITKHSPSFDVCRKTGPPSSALSVHEYDISRSDNRYIVITKRVPLSIRRYALMTFTGCFLASMHSTYYQFARYTWCTMHTAHRYYALRRMHWISHTIIHNICAMQHACAWDTEVIG